MKYLLDTCIIIEHLRGKRAINPDLIKQGCAISSMSYAELMYGAELSLRPDYQKNLVQQLIEELQIEIMYVDEECIARFAKQSAQLTKTGMTIDHFDSLIAATAITNQLTLVTYNQKHFSRIPDLIVLS